MGRRHSGCQHKVGCRGGGSAAAVVGLAAASVTEVWLLSRQRSPSWRAFG